MTLPLRGIQTRATRKLAGVLSAALLLIAGTGLALPAANAEGPVLHNVKYTVFSEVPFANAQIYYRDVDPPNFADYSHNPFVFSPKVNATVGPNQMWTLDVAL